MRNIGPQRAFVPRSLLLSWRATMKFLAAAAVPLLLTIPSLALAADQAAPSVSPANNADAPSGQNRFTTSQGQDQWLVGNLWNKTVYNAAGQKIGDLKDVLVDRDGKVVAVVVGVGGFLG